MIRHCDGTDPNLLRPIHPEGRRGGDDSPVSRYEPCDCGATFDDVEQMTVYPHGGVMADDQAGMIALTFSTRQAAAAMAYLAAQESGLTHAQSMGYALDVADRFNREHGIVPDWLEALGAFRVQGLLEPDEPQPLYRLRPKGTR